MNTRLIVDVSWGIFGRVNGQVKHYYTIQPTLQSDQSSRVPLNTLSDDFILFEKSKNKKKSSGLICLFNFRNHRLRQTQ